MSKKQNQQSSSKKGFAPFRWISRAFMGASRQYAEETLQQQEENRINDVEEIVSPGRQLVRNFMERKLAVFALCVVIAMFLFVFIGPLFLTNYSDSYTEVTQKSVPPTMSMMSVPRELRDDIKMIDANGSFTVGLSNAGKVYVWGATQIGTTGVNVANIPDEVKNTKIAMVAAGIDHIVAIGENGKVYAWGNNKLGQYGRTQEMIDNPNIAVMPEEIMVEGGIDVANVKKLTCGYQCSAILMNDGTLYMWGNKLTYANIDKFLDNHGLKDVAFLLNYIVGIKEEGTSVYTGTRGLYGTLRTNVYVQSQKTKDFLDGRTIERIVATSDTLCLELSDGSIALSGDFTSDCVEIPELEEDEHFLIGSISAGTYHYTGITNKGHVYSWGKNHFGQSNAPAKVQGAAQVFTGSFQNYAVDENGKLLGTWGLKGYLFGTDTYGADIFQRICAGGKMTMTIGAVAVIFSTIIGIIIGCLSGYFGGKVDMVLMRVTEIFTAIPFLPFAMILSSVMSQMTLSEDMRIFIIMVILGVLTLAVAGPSGTRSGAGGPRKRVRHRRQGHGRQRADDRLQAHPAQRGLRHSGDPDAGLRRLYADRILPELSGLRRSLSAAYLGQHAQRRQQRHHHSATTGGSWLFTSLFLAITTICINIVGDTLRDVMDPKSNIDK